MNTITLTPPLLTEKHIDKKIICIRAHRERIFNISASLRNGKLICHNYGQGGAGWTFLFGSVNKSINLFEEQLKNNPQFKNKPITVIGAGCYGLLTAITLARAGYNVNIIAKELDAISSYKAAGFFFPRARKCSTPEERAEFLVVGMDSYKTYLSIINGQHPFIKDGPKLLPAYYSLDTDLELNAYISAGLIEPPVNTTIDFVNGKKYPVMAYKIIFINPTIIMQQLKNTVVDLGIQITQQEIENFDEVDAPIIFNCTGLGAKKLADDARIVPVQGHLITLKNQPIENLQYLIHVQVVQTEGNNKRDELIYYAPKNSGILGITFIRGQDSLTANQHEFDRLIQRCQDFFGR